MVARRGGDTENLMAEPSGQQSQETENEKQSYWSVTNPPAISFHKIRQKILPGGSKTT
jgi:hypothetical protein